MAMSKGTPRRCARGRAAPAVVVVVLLMVMGQHDGENPSPSGTTVGARGVSGWVMNKAVRTVP